MTLEFRRFRRENFPPYVSWFADPELNRRLGPIDEGWLEAVRSRESAEGITWAVFREEVFVAVAEVTFDPQNARRAAITGLAVKPELRKRGICRDVLEGLLRRHRNGGILKHTAYIGADNGAARQCFERAGFVPLTLEPNEHGYLEFQHG